MKPVAVGQSLRLRIETNDSHTAAHYGNEGFAVIATPVLIGFLETAANECLRPSYDPGEGSVGIHVNVRHLAGALPGAWRLIERSGHGRGLCCGVCGEGPPRRVRGRGPRRRDPPHGG